MIKSQWVEPVKGGARAQLWSSMFGNLYNSIIWLGPVEANCCDSYKVDDSDDSDDSDSDQMRNGNDYVVLSTSNSLINSATAGKEKMPA